MRVSNPAAANSRRHGQVIIAGSLDGHDHVAQRVFFNGLPNALDGGLELGTIVFDGVGADKHLAVETADEHFGSRFGAIETNNAEMVRPDLLHTRVQYSAWLLNIELFA